MSVRNTLFRWVVFRPSQLFNKMVRTPAKLNRVVIHFLARAGRFPPLGIRKTRSTWGGVPGTTFTPKKGCKDDRILVYLHGGGYSFGSSRATHAALTSNLAKALKCPCLSVDYRLAPENPFPAAVEDVQSAWNDIASAHPNATILLSGDSAGGGLSLVLMQRLRQQGLRMPDAAFLFSPWTDLTCESATYKSHAKRDPFLFPRVVKDYARHYLGEDGDRRDPAASPIYGDLAGLPKTLVLVGDREILLDDSRILGEKAQAAGSPVEVEVWPEMVHVWPAFIPYIPEGKQALRRIAEWLA